MKADEVGPVKADRDQPGSLETAVGKQGSTAVLKEGPTGHADSVRLCPELCETHDMKSLDNFPLIV